MRRFALLLLLGIVYLLHEDAWLWPLVPIDSAERLWLGLPAVFLYHVGYCFLVAGVMALLVRFAWPREAFEEESGA